MTITKVEITISAERLANWLIDLCDLPKKLNYQTITEEVTIKTKAESEEYRHYIKAKTQEMLRKRFSVPERMESNQTVIINYEK